MIGRVALLTLRTWSDGLLGDELCGAATASALLTVRPLRALPKSCVADRLLREVERLGGAGALVDQADGQVGLESAGGIAGGP
ncbi:MAG: hypothetical protein ACKVJG_06755 [Candidatus Latescibacterota bacterium]